MIEFCEITKVFDSDLLKNKFTALDSVSFNIPKAKVIGFLGANGAGKTTLIKIAMDFIRPTSGEVKYNDILGGEKKHAFRRIGYLPERPYFYPHLTGSEFCTYMGKLAELSEVEIKKQIKNWAPKFKIDHAMDRRLNSYSKGMLQRIGFLATILHDPSLVILDEPLSGLDPIGRKELKDIITTLKNEGRTVFFSSHIVSDVEEICDSVVFLKSGKMVFQGSVDELINANIKPECRITYIENGRTKTIKVKEVEKRETITKILSESKDIVSIIPEKPSLEQIFYKVK